MGKGAVWVLVTVAFVNVLGGVGETDFQVGMWNGLAVSVGFIARMR